MLEHYFHTDLLDLLSSDVRSCCLVPQRDKTQCDLDVLHSSRSHPYFSSKHHCESWFDRNTCAFTEKCSLDVERYCANRTTCSNLIREKAFRAQIHWFI